MREDNKKLDADIWIICIVSLAVLCIYGVCNEAIVTAVRNSSAPVLPRVLLAAAFQFGLAGLGITAVSVLRKESFLSHGLQKQNALSSILLSFLCFLPHLLFLLITGRVTGYLPFQSVWTTREVLYSGFPVNALGMLITAIAWGFFEGFNYVFISDKINARYPSANPWLNRGAIACAILCVLIHGAIGVTAEGVIEMLTVMLIIYGMLLVRQKTGNAWGCVAVFVLLWNAF